MGDGEVLSNRDFVILECRAIDIGEGVLTGSKCAYRVKVERRRQRSTVTTAFLSLGYWDNGDYRQTSCAMLGVQRPAKRTNERQIEEADIQPGGGLGESYILLPVTASEATAITRFIGANECIQPAADSPQRADKEGPSFDPDTYPKASSPVDSSSHVNEGAQDKDCGS